MPSQFDPVEKIYSVHGVNVSRILQEFAASRKVDLPPLEEVLGARGSKMKKKLIENALRRQEEWRQNLARTEARQKKTASLVERLKAKKEIVDIRVAKKRIESLQQKNAVEEGLIAESIERRKFDRREALKRIAENVEKRREERSELREKQEIRQQERLAAERTAEEQAQLRKARREFVDTNKNFEERRAERNEATEKQQERQRVRMEQQPTVEESREETVKELALLSERREKTREAQKEVFEKLKRSEQLTTPTKEKRAEQQQDLEHREKFKENLQKLEESLTELRESIKEAEETALARAQEKNEIIASDEKREQAQDNLQTIAENAARKIEAKQELALDRLKKLKQLLQDIFENPRRLREKENKAQLLLERIEKMEQRLEDIFGKAAEKREAAAENLDAIADKARRKSAKALLSSGNLAALRKALDDLAFFEILNDRHDFIFEKTDTAHDKDRGEINQIELNAVERRGAGSLRFVILGGRDTKNLVIDSLMKRLERTGKLLRRNRSTPQERLASQSEIDPRAVDPREKSHAAPRSIYREGNLKEIKLMLQQENFKSILSGMLIDKALQVETVLQQHGALAQIDENQKSGNETGAAQNQSFFDHIVHLVHTIDIKDCPPHRHQEYDDIYIMLNYQLMRCHPTMLFNSLAQTLKEGLRKVLLSYKELHERFTAQEIAEKKEAKEQDRLGNAREKKRAKRAHARKARLKKLIREQNLTAQEKANNERNLIDLFF